MILKEETRYRWMVASRVFIAAIGGYALTSAATIFLALVWPLPKAQAVMASAMLSFTLYAVIVIWVFSIASVKRAWCWIIGATLVLSLIDWWMLSGAAA
jgi:hypothetical protein